ncbi:MAG: GC-type dockerin domain-anchored protein [Phycisphaerales bacterium]
MNGSGATLLEALFSAPANTLDFIDVDGDGFVQEQLAQFDVNPPFLSGQYWQFNYRVVGSGNGLAELRDWGTLFATEADGSSANLTLNSSFADAAYNNTQLYVNAGVTQGAANGNNPGAIPLRSLDDGSYSVTTGTGAGTGVQIDFNALDVPVLWFQTVETGSALFNRVPGAPGYGNNPRVATDPAGTPLTQSNKLRSLVSPNGLTLNTDISNPDDLTVYDFPITLTPVAAPVNIGVGMQEIEMSNLRHGFATGRLVTGENLVFVTRDSGSGTRNAFANGICLDPSWCVGENIGNRTSSSTNDRIGPDWQASNKGGSSRMEATVINHRLAVGHTGAERGESRGWLTNGRMELLAVRADIRGGSVFARPTIENVVDGGADGYAVYGVGGIATVGDPLSAPASAGGWGWDPSEVGANPNPIQPMRNERAAAYVNNILRSVSAVTAVPSDPSNAFSPGEFLASQFVLPATTFNTVDIAPDPSDDCVPLIVNSARNDVLTQFVLADSGNALANSAYESYNTTTNGTVPTRTTGVTYTDGVAGGSSYRSINGTDIDYASPLGDTDGNGTVDNDRNKIAGDFNGDGMRSPADVQDMIDAWGLRNNGGSWSGGSINPDGYACPELLGDFTGDGNFDAADVRYFADGLHLVGGMLDREAGFTAVDAAFAGNFFGTALATGTYDNGDSRGDVAGNNSTRGYNPVGHDGMVDAADIDYICANFGDWTDLNDAVSIDLSADMNGDLVVDSADVAAIVEGILDSTIGDVNLDGVVNADDAMVAEDNLGNAGGYADGDVNCDGIVDANDVAIINAAISCPADIAAPFGVLNFFDISAFIGLYNANDPAADIAAPFGTLNFFDISAFIGFYNAGCP